jgi:hypothetical protein
MSDADLIPRNKIRVQPKGETMPTLTLSFAGEPLAFEIVKIDRDKLYGYVETETLDETGQVCTQALLTPDGHTVAGPGNIALAYWSPAGLWREKEELRSVDATDGSIIVPVKSTFAFPVNLDNPAKRATLDQVLDHAIRLVYRLIPEVGSQRSEVSALTSDFRPLTSALVQGTIFTFPFSYRGGDLASVGFVLLGSDGGIYLLVGNPVATEYVGLDAPASVAEEDIAEEEEELDFALI